MFFLTNMSRFILAFGKRGAYSASQLLEFRLYADEYICYMMQRKAILCKDWYDCFIFPWLDEHNHDLSAQQFAVCELVFFLALIFRPPSISCFSKMRYQDQNLIAIV
jgi:hypothetical protein